jgi:hypothetical protein
MTCCYCGSDIDPERAEIYSHCPASPCVVRWRSQRMTQYSLHLVPKQGFTVVPKGTVLSGKSSGR